MGIHARNIRKKFGDYVALNDVSLEVKTGELVALLGPSGSGKTTLLRVIAGLEFADSGEVLLDGEEAGNKSVGERNVGFVFQHYALFKHMTVFENVAFGLRVRDKERRPSDKEIARRVLELLELVHLDTLRDRYPPQLSGGQRQRVALARALAVEPKVLLLDEPFGALDAKVRKELRRWMRRLHDEVHITSLFVTHDQEEAMEVSDRVVVMSNGRIEQTGTPSEVWHAPANAFVYDFLGNYNEFEGWREADGTVSLADTEPVRSSALRPRVLPKEAPHPRPEGAKPVKVYARPHEMEITKTPQEGQEYIHAKVIHVNPAGALVKIELERPGGKLLQAEAPPSICDINAIAKGDSVYIRPLHTRVFD